MSDLRELIAGRIWHDDWVKSVGEEPPYSWDSEEYEDGMSAAVDAEYRDTADRIIELVREALLSDAAVEAAHDARNGTAVWDFVEREVVEGEEGSTRDIITAAFNAAMGGDGHE